MELRLFYKDNRAEILGMDFGVGIQWEATRTDPMQVLQSVNGVHVLYVPGQSYWVARWRRGYNPAHYLIIQSLSEPESLPDNKGIRYASAMLLASVPLRRGAKQTEGKES